MRYERKYRIEGHTFAQVKNVLLHNPASFQKAYPDRRVNSIYFDSVQFDALNDNLAGVSDRYKYRIRWYGEDLKKIEDPILEKKIKHNQLGTKEYQKVPNFELNKDLQLGQFLKSDQAADQLLKPVIVVSYLRSYFVSFDKKVRATIDRKVRYFPYTNLNFISNSALTAPAIILEVKYDQSLDGKIDHILQSIPYKVTKNSKYVEGMAGHYY